MMLDICKYIPQTRTMWKIERRDFKIKEWEDVGEAVDLKAAADMILKKESSKAGALFLDCYVDPYSDFGGKDDTELLCRFDYKNSKWFYLVTRQIH